MPIPARLVQNRRNSTVGYDKAASSPGCNGLCAGDHGDVLFCQSIVSIPRTANGTYATDLADMLSKNRVTAASPASPWTQETQI